MDKYKLFTVHKHLLADTVTPVSIYLQLRDKYRNCILLESSDYHGNENSFSYICCDPMGGFELKNQVISRYFPDGKAEQFPLTDRLDAVQHLQEFIDCFYAKKHDYNFVNNGLFGYMAYDAVTYYEDISLTPKDTAYAALPDINYSLYRYVIVVDHFKNDLYIFEHSIDENNDGQGLANLEALIRNKNIPSFSFSANNDEVSNFTDEAFLKVLAQGKEHCKLGNVFQIVLSRRFTQGFKGDEFNVYRALRSINPSPYLFYFDYGNFKIFGSSPEAQILLKGNKASIFPIAGTFRRTGDDASDADLARKLYEDPKENSEHVMLVDLARNDLSRHGEDVTVEVFKEVQYYSHVIHLVSEVTSTRSKEVAPMLIVADTFPAGTLSGAPKYKAMTIIDELEPTGRGYYGGCIGFIGFNGDFNHAIMIRSFLSVQNQLHYQAGAGVVAKSELESELNEVNHKLAALRKALVRAAEI